MYAQQYRRYLPLAFLFVIVLSGCVAVAPAATVSAAEVPVDSLVSTQTIDVAVPSISAETEALLYMREEEKLARDVYLALYDKWGMNVFDNIARAESQHMEAVLLELTARNVADPVADFAPGVFANDELQALYDELVAQGSESIVSALVVGATIEDLDIADLQESLEDATTDSVRLVFENLMRGSENHLRAFVRNLSRYGETYEPAYIDADTYDSIVTGDQFARSSQVGRGQRRWQ